METFSVGELTSFIKRKLETLFSMPIHVQGEATNVKEHSSGHIYFDLNDASSKTTPARISCAFFRQARRGTRGTLKNGDLVVVFGDISVYPPRGSYQLIVQNIEWAGLGALFLRLHEIKEKLRSEGLFNLEGRQPLPFIPKTIGVVTSPTGAAIRDILHVLQRRYPGFHLVLFPVKVQGETAAQEIALAIEECARYQVCDLLIVGRGGGSFEDLWAFNEEIVVRALADAAKKISAISAVGHEPDRTLSDEVAFRAPTPSAAAEKAVPEKRLLLQSLEEKKQYIARFLQQKVAVKKRNLRLLAQLPCFSNPSYFLAKWSQKLDEKGAQLCLIMERKLEKARLSLTHMKERHQAHNPRQWIADRKRRLEQYRAHFAALHPDKLLQKGYTILFAEGKDRGIFSAKELVKGDKITAKMHDGVVTAVVEQIDKGST
ncbi:MAG: exodeoxyribonuclease VII large subunit [Chlamydiota bacterium]